PGEEGRGRGRSGGGESRLRPRCGQGVACAPPRRRLQGLSREKPARSRAGVSSPHFSGFLCTCKSGGRWCRGEDD
ncbi:hypothetical protein U0070_007039, partial [Myodes glareolus]